jgi:FtsP/CotA-like multicopper oxidase with cupredoxin domain
MNWNRSPLPRRHRGAPLTVAVLAVLGLLGGQAVAAPGLGAAASRVVTAATRASVPVAAAVPQGSLTPRGCTVSGTTATCELWAKTGTTDLLGQPMPIWGYATSAAAAPTAPGPVLVVTQGQTVTMVLHNQLPQRSALAFPGQPATAFTGTAPGGVVAGVDTGGTDSYTFTASRPGTFLYEAGHTPDGARQVALGLSGALVVLPANGVGAYGTGQTAYDDEAVLVLSELDPALNQSADPAHFDLRRFQARYRLINGRVFPSTDPVSTGVGRTVLLRYVNAGAIQHPMNLLGGSQQRIALDGYPADHPTSSLVADLAPGSTMDTLVRMPSAGGAKLTLFEAGGHLDNNGMTEGDPTRIAAGGMMTFLDTAAPPPSTDVVGPVPSRLTVSPNPADGSVPVTVTADVTDLGAVHGVVDAAELVVDDATSQQAGFGLPMQSTGGFGSATVHVTGAIPVGTANDSAYCTANPITLSCLSAGRHRIFVRGHDSNGNWGVISDVLLNLPKVGPLSRAGRVTPDPTNGGNGVDIDATGDDSSAGGTINQAEWSLDTLAPAGSGTPMAVGGGGTIAALTAHVPATAFTSVAEGTHHVFVRSHDSLGLWGPELDIPFTVDKTGPTVNAAAVAPNPTNGKLDDPGNPGSLVVSASITDAAGGIVVGAEGFLDPGPTPTPGAGFPLVATDGALDSGAESVYGLIPLSAINGLTEGDHRVVVRGRDNAGNWGEVFNAPLVVDRVAPTLGALTAAPNPTNGSPTVAISGTTSESGLNAAEVWLGNDPGKGKATPATISVNTAGTTVTVTVAVPPFMVGTRVVNVRIQDKAGNWSNARGVVVTVRGGNPPTGSAAALLGFASQTGNVIASATAGIPRVGGNQGMLATAASNAPAYVSTTVASPAHGVQLAFAVNRNTLRTSTNGIITLLDGRTAAPTGNGVFAVQMRTTSATAAQIRGVLTRSNGTAVEGAWVNFPTGAHLVTVTWVSGPATGTGRGQLRVTLDNATVINQFADTATRALSSLRLGVVDATTPAARSALTGSMFVDAYTAMGIQ